MARTRTDSGRRASGRLIAGLLLVSVSACTGEVAVPTTAETVIATTTTTTMPTTTTLRDCSRAPGIPKDEIDVIGAPSVSIALSNLDFPCAHQAIVAADTADAIRAAAILGANEDVPVLVDGADIDDELDRLGASAVRWVGPAPAPEFGLPTTIVQPAVGGDLPPAPADAGRVWVYEGDPDAAPLIEAAASARGDAFVDVTAITDLRSAAEEVIELLSRPEAVAVGLRADRGRQLATVRSATELPGGGWTFDGTRLVAFYGNPTTRALGVLGEQDPAGTLERLSPLVEEYSADGLRGVPTFEIIATVASARPGADNNYTDETSLDTLRPWIEFAGENGVYVILDLQPGRIDFLTQAKRYEEFLRLPHVGLALDPEWRLKPDQVHLRQIGTVDAEEINTVSRWLTEIVREEKLPQKYLIIHQFRFSMITNRELIETPDELYTVIQMDGQGPLPSKYETYRVLTAGQDDVGWAWGWKNFYDEDSPMATPAEVLAVRPTVVFVSFQ